MTVDGVNPLEVCEAGEVDPCLDGAGEVEAAFGKQRLQVLHHPDGLAGDGASGRVKADLPRCEDAVAARPDRLRGIGCVEGSLSRVGGYGRV